MVGSNVDKTLMDTRAVEAVLLLRNAFDKTRAIAKFLANHPITTTGGTPDPDPLIALLGYSAADCATLRTVFEGFDAARTTLDYNFDVARKITGLE